MGGKVGKGNGGAHIAVGVEERFAKGAESEAAARAFNAVLRPVGFFPVIARLHQLNAICAILGASSAMGDLLGEDIALVQPNNLYRCLDKLTAHKQAMFTFLGERWKDLFQADMTRSVASVSLAR
jgi:hypothetical protein